MHVDYLIIGQGIAGTVLCEHLIKAGKSVIVIDESTLSNSSKVAGGLYNPITGRKMVKTWNCDALFNYLTPFYRALEVKLGERFLIEKPIYRPFMSTEELNEWMGKSAESIYQPYIGEIKDKPAYANHVKDQFGGIILKQCGYVDTATMVSAYRDYLKINHLYKSEAFDYAKLVLTDRGVEYEGIHAKKVIFCDGKFSQSNPFFDWLPLRPVKGELLFVKTKTKIEVIYNRGVFVIPLSNRICKVGATYDHENVNENITSKAENELRRRLKQLAVFDFEVIDQKAGVRPATKDRKPFVGIHPKHSQVVVFNGLGAKGVSLAPFYANQLTNHLEFGDHLDSEVNIERFFSLF
ncbi:NAD(P)/FAD-dependent oxidoreductase [Roseivirga sp.]|uniref:NAD(P)/FAD-dependent oxidoreductase n=1 Tax=Roseivirga sp. TaxID=1964215 RepID=UPI003B8B2731